VQQQRRSVATASQIERDLSAHAVYLCSTKLIKQAGFCSREEGLSGCVISSSELRLRSRQRTRRPLFGIGRE